MTRSLRFRCIVAMGVVSGCSLVSFVFVTIVIAKNETSVSTIARQLMVLLSAYFDDGDHIDRSMWIVIFTIPISVLTLMATAVSRRLVHAHSTLGAARAPIPMRIKVFLMTSMLIATAALAIPIGWSVEHLPDGISRPLTVLTEPIIYGTIALAGIEGEGGMIVGIAFWYGAIPAMLGAVDWWAIISYLERRGGIADRSMGLGSASRDRS